LKALSWLLLLLAVAGASLADERTVQTSDGRTVTYRVVGPDEPSALPVARRILGHLAAGELEEAARLSNEPSRRTEVLRDYQRAVGEAEFRRVYAEYLRPPNRVAAEIAIGRRRLLIWQLASLRGELAGQYYIETDGTFLLDDRPGAERRVLQEVLTQQRKERGVRPFTR
jgi:hypothetical protein